MSKIRFLFAIGATTLAFAVVGPVSAAGVEQKKSSFAVVVSAGCRLAAVGLSLDTALGIPLGRIAAGCSRFCRALVV